MSVPTPGVLPGLRLTTVTAAAWAELVLRAGGLVSTRTLVGAWVVLAVAVASAMQLRTGLGPMLRRALATGVMAVALLASFTGAGPGTATDLATRLGFVVVLAVPANVLVQESLRDLYVGLSLTGATLVLAAGLAQGEAVAVPLLVGAVLVVVCLVRLAAARVADAPVVVAVGGSSTMMVVTAAAAVVVVGLVAFLLVPHPRGLHATGRLAAAAHGVPDLPAAGGPSPGDPRSTSGYVGRLDLRMRGALPDDPVASVPWQAPRLWRDQVFATYDGSSWYPPAPALSMLDQSSPGTFVVPQEEGSATRPTRTDTVMLAPNLTTPLLLSPGQPTSVTTSGALARTSLGSYLFVRQGSGTSYAVSSVGYDTLQPTAGVAAGRDSRDLDDPQWVRLPGSVPARVLSLGRSLVAGASDRAEAVRRVETYLRTHERYRLDAPVPAPGEDSVDAFLFDSHEGFCEQFASAETVLLRAAGIPSRVVTGYAYGRPAPDGRRLFVGSDAHAWVEVYSPGVGWVASDPTAGAALAGPTGGLRERLSQALRRDLASATGRAVLAVGLMLLVGLGAGVALLLGRRRHPAIPRERGGRLLAALGRLEAALAAQGRGRRPGETLQELAARLVREDPAALAAAHGLEVVAGTAYAPAPPPPPQRAAAAAALETYAATLEAQQTKAQKKKAQKKKGHQAARGPWNDRAVAATAPEDSSRTRPASASAPSGVSPR